MILIAEIVMLLGGIYALITGRLWWEASSKYVVSDRLARVIGLIWILPIPLAIFIGMMVTVIVMRAGGATEGPRSAPLFWCLTIAEIIIVVACGLAPLFISRLYGTPGAEWEAPQEEDISAQDQWTEDQ